MTIKLYYKNFKLSLTKKWYYLKNRKRLEKEKRKKRENIFKNNFYILISRPRAACEELCLQSKQARGSCWFFRSAENSPMKKQLLLSENNNICTCSDARPIYSIKQIDPKRISSRLTFQLITHIPHHTLHNISLLTNIP